MKLLTPIRDKDQYSEQIFKYIAEQMYIAMFQPLFNILGRKPEATLLSNALDKSSVTAALNSGIIWYYENKFYGTFNSNIGRELRKLGANFNSLDKTYFIKAIDLPMHIRAAISESSSKFKAQQDALRDALNKMNNPPQIEMKHIIGRLDSMFIDLHKQFSASIPKDLAVPMDITPNMREAIAEDYTYNMNKYIKKWYEDDIIKLRERVEEAVKIGYRADHMRDILMAEYGVAERKAKFLARQEGSLLVSKYRETRYKEAGLMRYQWSTSHDQRVRHDHRELNDRIFDWDHPPITDKHTGARNNPGEDFNCVPADSNIDLAYGIRKCFRRWYRGKLTTIITASGKTIRATPNHQVLTSRGWKAIGMLDDSDYIIDLSEQLIKSSERNINSCVSSIGNIFESFAKQFGVISCNDCPINFHGDGTNGNVDIVCTTRSLMTWTKSFFLKFLNNLNFTFSNKFTFLKHLFFMYIFKPFFRCMRINAFFSINNASGFFSNHTSFLKSRIFESQNISLRTITDFNTGMYKTMGNNNSLQSCSFRNGENALSTEIRLHNWFNIQLDKIRWHFTFPSIGIDAHFSKIFRNCLRTKADDLSNFSQRFSSIQKLDRVIQKSYGDFSGNVYNLETCNNWFMIDGLLYHNCRCVAIPIIE